MINQNNTTWKHGFQQRTGLDVDQDRANQIIKENHEPKTDKIDIAIRLSENVNDKDKNLVITKKQLIDLVLKDNEESEQQIRKLLSLSRGKLNSFVSHVRQELK